MSNTIGGDYYHTMDKEYRVKNRVGPHVFEDVEGKFTQSLPKWIRSGIENIELQLGTGRAGEHGPESYGKESRAELKTLAKVTGVDIHAVHAPVHVQGLSGFDAKSKNFSDHRRDTMVNEIAKTIDFAADVTQGSNIVFHLGEFPRSMAQHFKEFEEYEGEEKTGDIWWGDRAAGGIGNFPRDHKIPIIIRDYNGRPELEKIEKTSEKGKFSYTIEKFKTTEMDWNEFNEQLKGLKKEFGDEEGKNKFMRMHSLDPTKPSKEWGEDIVTQASISEQLQSQFDETNAQKLRWERELERSVRQMQNPEIGEEMKEGLDEEIETRKHLIADADRKLLQFQRRKDNLVPIETLAVDRTADTLARAAIIAWEKTQEKHLDKPITLVPENLSPQEYGSHPEEMIEIVNHAREFFVQRLTANELPDPRGIVDPKTGDRLMIKNQYKRDGVSVEQAEELANKHIRSTIDAQHLQMWQQHFRREEGESEGEREKRFYEWYDEKLRKLMKSDTIGHVHIVDGMGRGHVHLPFGQGRLREMSEAVDELRSMGLSMTHEGWTEGPERHFSEGWTGTEKMVYGLPSGDMPFENIYNKYLGGVLAPSYLTPDETDFSSDKEDFTMWSQVPLE